MQWVCLQDAPPVPSISWSIRTLQPPPEQEHPQYGEHRRRQGSRPSLLSPDPASAIPAGGLDFDAILLRPSEGPTAQKPPLVVMPHGESLPPAAPPPPSAGCGRVVSPHCLPLAGGPHTVFSAGWMLYPAVLCRVGFAVLLGEQGGRRGTAPLQCPQGPGRGAEGF